MSGKKREKSVKKCEKNALSKKANFFFFDFEDALFEVLNYESTKIYYLKIIFIIFMHC